MWIVWLCRVIGYNDPPLVMWEICSKHFGKHGFPPANEPSTLLPPPKAVYPGVTMVVPAPHIRTPEDVKTLVILGHAV